MIYTASYWEPKHYHGLLVPISFGIPSIATGYEFHLENPLKFFTPQSTLLKNARANRLTESEYTRLYRTQMIEYFQEIEYWLKTLTPDVDQTLLTWEKQGEFSHRNLVIKFVEQKRPDCYGGIDVLNTSVHRMATGMNFCL